jgi:hypothetical protein
MKGGKAYELVCTSDDLETEKTDAGGLPGES